MVAETQNSMAVDIIDGKKQKPLLVIVGATAIGKTALSLQMAAQFDGEIVSADSRLLYRGMDIGTAKPTTAEQAIAPHHLIDICNPDETVTLGDYQQRCFATIDAIHARRHLPILVGGTGQYVKAIVDGWGIPKVAPQPALRAELELRDSADLHAQLVALDAVSAEKIHPNNRRRAIRALEVCLVTGQRMSDLQKKQPPPYNILMVGLDSDRQWLYDRIDGRVDSMMAAGFLAEMQALQAAGYARSLPSMSGLGYQQLWQYLAGELTLDAAVERIKFETHRFVRHQNNWFQKEDARIVRVGVSAETYPQSALDIVASWLQTHES